MSEPKRYFQLFHTDEHGCKTYRIHGIRRCAITGRYVTSGEKCRHDTQPLLDKRVITQ